jgi:hypothetical protein
VDVLIDDKKLSAAETSLADDPLFGDDKHISARLFDKYTGLLAMVAETQPGARAVIDAARGRNGSSLFGDPLVRRTIEDAVCLHVLGRDVIDRQVLGELLATIAECAISGRTAVLDERRIGDASHHGYLWTGSAVDRLPARWFRDQCTGRLDGFRIEQPDAETSRVITAGAQVLDGLLPALSRSALSHAAMAVVATRIDGAFNSLTVPGLPGTVFLSPTVLATPLRAAEALLHESMHLKLMDIDYFEYLFAPGFRPQDSPRITPPWLSGTQKGEWPLDRLLTAMHVYAALAVFFGRVANAPDGGGEVRAHAIAQHRQGIERSQFLVGAAQDNAGFLSGSGQVFVTWISQVLKDLDA